jgi:pimeloyl-ACP methyl ester carboxylesterase
MHHTNDVNRLAVVVELVDDHIRQLAHDTFESPLTSSLPSGIRKHGEPLREMCFRIAWKPYMYSQTLPHLLASVEVPTLIAWGDKDKIVPISTAKRFLAALPNARLEVIKDCGHCVDLEQPERLSRLVTPFIAR